MTMNDLDYIAGNVADHRKKTTSKSRRFREALDDVDSDSRCRYSDVPGIAKFFQILARVIGVAGLLGAAAVFYGMWQELFDPAMGILLLIGVLVTAVFGRSLCMMFARGLWIACDIEKNTRLAGEATLHLTKMLERQVEREAEEETAR
jgi:hypothetical protein